MKFVDGLPEFCFGISEMTGEVILIKRGERGYWECFGGALKGEERAKELNDRLGITKAQAEAMVAGSLFGWHVPAARPEMYDEQGRLI